MEPLIQSEVKNFLDAKIIFWVRHYKWVANLVLVRKKYGEISVIADFTTHGRSHIYGLPCPSTDSLDPMDLYYTLISKDNPQNLLVYTYTWLLKQYSRVYAAFDLKPTYIGMYAKWQIFFGVFLIWVRITWLLAFQIPWEHSDSTLHYLFGVLYKKSLGYTEGRGIKE